MVEYEVDCNTTRDQHIDSYISSIEGDDAIEFKYVITQDNIDKSFLRIPIPKTNHNENLAPTILIRIDKIIGVRLSRSLVELCDAEFTMTVIIK